jgi:outer membrane receptor for ferrienterochelin and colicins
MRRLSVECVGYVASRDESSRRIWCTTNRRWANNKTTTRQQRCRLNTNTRYRSEGSLHRRTLIAIAVSTSFSITSALFSDPVHAAETALQTTEPKQDDKDDKSPPKTDAKAEVKAESKGDKKPAAETEKIEVKAAAEYDARREDTATKLVVTSAEINKYGDTQLADVLKRLPGITVIGNQIRMRGLGGGYTQFLIDGERAPPGFSIDQLSPSAIERIEIVRAATAEFSTQSIAGTINIILKKKVSLAQREVRAGYGRGSFFEGYNTSFLVSDKKDNLSYTMNGFLYQNESRFPYRTREEGFDASGARILLRESGGRSSGDNHGGGFGPRLVWNFKNGDSLTWSSFLNINRGDGTGNFAFDTTIGRPVLSTRTDNRYEYVSDFFRTDLNWIAKLADGAKLDTKLGMQLNKNRNENFSQGFNAANQQNVSRSSFDSRTEPGVSFSGTYSTPIVEGHSLVAGWDTGINRVEQESRQRDISFPGVLPVVPVFNSETDFDATITKLAVFAQDEWNVTKEWSVYLGLRWESLITTSEGNTYSEIRNRSAVWSPIMQTLYKLPGRKGEQVRLALTRTYKAPNTNDLIPRRFFSSDNQPTSPDFTGNPNLQPELATGVDVAFEKFWDQGASVSVSGSIRRISDVINRRGLRLIDGRWVTLPVNEGTATTRSIEFDTKFPWQRFWKAAPPVDFRFNMNRNWSKVSTIPGPNNRLDQQVPFSATLGLDYRMKNGVVVAGTSYSYREGGEVRTGVSQTANISSKRDLDAYVLWKITPKTQLRLSLSNILKPAAVNETTYFDSLGRTITTRNQPSKMNVRAGIEIKL